MAFKSSLPFHLWTEGPHNGKYQLMLTGYESIGIAFEKSTFISGRTIVTILQSENEGIGDQRRNRIFQRAGIGLNILLRARSNPIRIRLKLGPQAQVPWTANMPAKP